MIKYSPNQAYCTIAEFDPKIKRKYVCVEQTDNPYCLKISSVQVSQTNFYHFHLTIRFLNCSHFKTALHSWSIKIFVKNVTSFTKKKKKADILL